MAADAIPAAIRHIVRDAESILELNDGTFVPKHGQTDPSDPLLPLTPARWQEELAKTEPDLFMTSGKAL